MTTLLSFFGSPAPLIALGAVAVFILILALALARSLAGQWGAIDEGQAFGGDDE